MSGKTSEPHVDFGNRLVPVLIDDFAKNDPTRVFASVPLTHRIEDSFQDITFGDLGRAINRCSWWMEQNLGVSKTFETLNYVGPQDLRYVILLFAAIKTGYKIFFSWPFNSVEAHLALLDALDCNKTLLPEVVSPTIQTVLSERQMQTLTIPSLQSLLDIGSVPLYPYTKTFAEAKSDPYVVLHTSGTTGLPKPVILTHGTIAPPDTFLEKQEAGRAPIALSLFSGMRVFLGLFLFHSAGICMLAFSIYSNTIAVLPPPTPLTPEIANLYHVHGNVNISFLSPHILVQLVKTPEYLENLRRLRYLTFGGGPLPRATGKILASYVHVFVTFGATETGVFRLELPEPEDWEYVSFDPKMGFELREFATGLYEFIFVRDPALEAYQGVFSTFPNLTEYSMKDLYSKHPTKEGLWLFEGRSDDMIICSNGVKVNPMTMEGLLNAHPSVVAAIVCGQGRSRVSLLVEVKNPPKDAEEKRELVEELWETIERGNMYQPSFDKIPKELVIFTTSEKPMLRAGKGTVLRKMTVNSYGKELDDMYGAFLASDSGS